MVNILPQIPKKQNFGSLFAQEVSKGLSSGYSAGAKLAGERGKKSALARQRVPTALRSARALYDPKKDQLPEVNSLIEDRAYKLLDEGYSPEDAARLAYRDVLKIGGEGTSEEPPEKGFSLIKESERPEWERFVSEIKGFGKNVKEAALKDTRYALSALETLKPLMEAKNKLYEKLGLQTASPELIKQFDELTGGQGIPQGNMEKLAASTILGPAGFVGESIQQIGEHAHLPQSVTDATSFIAMLLTHRAAPKKSPQFRMGDEILVKAERGAAKSGISPEEFVTEAQAKSGADLSKVAAGDAVESEKLRKAMETIERVKETPKTVFNPKAGAAERAEFKEKLKESPIDEYYAIEKRKAEKLANRKAETVARDEALVNELRPLEAEAHKAVQNEINNLNELRRQSRSVSKENVGQYKKILADQNSKIASEMEKLRDIQYHMKHGKPRETIAQAEARVQKRIQGLKEEAMNPIEAGQKDILETIESDKKYIDRAEKLLDIGPLPGEFHPDTYVNINRKYLDAYKQAAEAQRELIKGLKGESLEKEKRFLSYLENRIKGSQAKLISQIEKVKAIRALEKPSGAFYKHQLRRARSDIEQFQKDFIRMNKIKSAETRKAEKVFKARETVKAREPAKAEVSEAKVAEVKEDLGKIIKEHPEKLKEAIDGNPKAEKNIIDVLIRHLNRQKIPQKIKVSLAIGTIQAAIEEMTGEKIPQSWLVSAGIGQILGGTATAGFSTLVYSQARKLFETPDVYKLKNAATSPSNYRKALEDIRKRRGESRVRAIKERAFPKSS